jgi:hypothetical protein
VETVNTLMLLEGHGGATWCEQTTRRPPHSPALATIAAGSECAFAKMVTYVHVLSAAWVLIKGHKESAVDVLRVTQGADVRHAVCGVGWGIGGKLAEESEELRHTFGPARYLVRLDQTPTPKPSTRLSAANARTSELQLASGREGADEPVRDTGGALRLMPLCCMQVSGLKSVVEMRGCAGRLEMATISQSSLYSDSI